MKEFVDWLLESSWQATVIALIVAILLLVGSRRLPPAWRYGLLLLVALRFLLPDLPQSPVSAYQVVPSGPGQAWEHMLPEAPLPSVINPYTRKLDSFPRQSILPNRPRAIDWSAMVYVVWAAGVTVLAIWLAGGQILLQRRIRRGTVGELEGRSLAVYREAVGLSGLRRVPRTRLVEGVTDPVLVGIVRPEICLPSDIESRLSPAQLRLVLLHECIHVRRWDPWTHLFSLAAWLIHWWNPVSWWLLRRLRAERELATDLAVLERIRESDRREYGETLLTIAEGATKGRAPSPALGILERHEDLKRRLTQIASGIRDQLRWSIVGATVVVVMGFLLLAKQTSPDLEPIPTDTQERSKVVRDFMAAVRDGNVERVGRYLDRGMDVDEDDNYCTALYSAASYGNAEMVRYLLKRGANLDKETSWGDVATKRACFNGHKEVADILIAAGGTVDPILYASGTGDLNQLKQLALERPFDYRRLEEAIRFATVANRTNTFDWLWVQMGFLGGPEFNQRELLGSLYISAGEWGSLDILKRLEGLGVDVKAFGPEALAKAVIWDREAEAHHLLEKGVSPTDVPPNYGSSLRAAAGDGQLAVVRALVEHGADLEERDSQGMTPLGWAAYSRREEVCAYLIEAGANIENLDDFGSTPLWNAAFGGNAPETVELLLKKGARVGGTNKRGEAILNAMQGFTPPIVGEVAFPGIMYDEAAVREQQARTRKVAELLIDAGADMNALGFMGTPLMKALEGNHPEIADVLIEKGADLQKTDKVGNTAIALAFFGSWKPGVDVALVRKLLDRGADPNATFTQPNTTPVPAPVPILDVALRNAGRQHDHPEAMQEVKDVIALLLDRGAKFQVDGSDLVAEWFAAAATGDIKALKRLNAAGVSLDSTDKFGWTALGAALAMQQPEAVGWLIRAGASPVAGALENQPLLFAVEDRNIDLVKKFIAAGAPVTAGPLMVAASDGSLEIFKFLLEAGGDVSTLPVSGPVRFGHTKILKIMLERGADANRKWNSENRNDVYWAVYYDRPECLQLLLDHGAEPNEVDRYGESPLSYAEKFRGHLVPMLRKAIAKSERKTGTPAKAGQNETGG